jgi:hypothetical protein
MSKLRDVEFDGVVRSDYIKESDGKLTIKQTQDVEPVLKKNKQLITLNDGYSKSRDLKRVASIPNICLTIWAKEYNGTNNWFAIPHIERKKILRKKLNSNEYRYFRSSEGKL